MLRGAATCQSCAGGVATFTLLATQPFALTLQADPKRSAGVFPSPNT